MASGTISQTGFQDITSTLTFNEQYFDSHANFNLYTDGVICVLNVNFNLNSSIDHHTSLVTGIPNKSTVYGTVTNSSRSFRARVYSGMFQIEEAATAGWYNGNFTFVKS